MNRLGVIRKAAYVLVGVVLWVSVLKSGVHATLAGVALAFTIPLTTKGTDKSLLKTMEHDLHYWVAFLFYRCLHSLMPGLILGIFQPRKP